MMSVSISEPLGKALLEMFVDIGYDAMPTEDKNLLVNFIANRDKMAITDITVTYLLNMLKKMKIEEMSVECENDVLNGFRSTNGHFYRTNRDDQINMIGQKDLLNGSLGIENVMWKTEDVGYIPHTREEWLNEVYYYGLNEKSKKLFRYNYLKNLVLNSEDESKITRINWRTETPELNGAVQ